MKLRHAAAMSLLGWYLMIPPDVPRPYDSSHWRSRVPVAGWTTVDSFSSSGTCKVALEKTVRNARQKQQSDNPSVRVADHLKFVAIKNNAACIPTGDPRLAKGSLHFSKEASPDTRTLKRP